MKKKKKEKVAREKMGKLSNPRRSRRLKKKRYWNILHSKRSGSYLKNYLVMLIPTPGGGGLNLKRAELVKMCVTSGMGHGAMLDALKRQNGYYICHICGNAFV